MADVWKDVQCEWFYASPDASETYDAEVRISDGSIAVSYSDGEGNWTTYSGKETGAGHYSLTSKTVNGKATLHRFPRSKILEGWWTEDGYAGMWRLYLNG